METLVEELPAMIVIGGNSKNSLNILPLVQSSPNQRIFRAPVLLLQPRNLEFSGLRRR